MASHGKWRPVFPMRKPDKIISSDCRARGDMYGFVPAYESEPKTNMYYLLSYEYCRMWFEERKKYEKVTYSMKHTLKEEKKIRRRFVPQNVRPSTATANKEPVRLTRNVKSAKPKTFNNK